MGDLPKESKKPASKQKYKKGPCPLRCELPHPNKSAFFCKLFRGKTLGERRVLVKEAGLCPLCLAKNMIGHLCPVSSCPRCSGGHNIRLCPQEDQEQTLIEAEGDDSSDDEEEIQAWLDNWEWNEMSVLPCKENPGRGSNLNTIQEVPDQDRVLTLMDTSSSPTLGTPGTPSKGNYTGPMTYPQEYEAPIPVKEIQETIRSLKARLARTEYEE